MTEASTPVPRTSARVILLDKDNRVLLFTGIISSQLSAVKVAWFLPDGGAEENETLGETAARELFEETGLQIEASLLRGPIEVSRGVWSDGTTTYRATDYVFILRVASWEVTTEGFTPLEQEQVIGHRWWTLPELQQSDAVIFPNRLASLVADAINGEIPSQPIDLPWQAI